LGAFNVTAVEATADLFDELASSDKTLLIDCWEPRRAWDGFAVVFAEAAERNPRPGGSTTTL
jgi:hypothetical protein